MNLKVMIDLCCIEVKQLRIFLYNFLRRHGYKEIRRGKGYIIAEGNIPACLIAHLDTVFRHQPSAEQFLFDPKRKVLWSPYGSGFDDRAGVYAIMEIIEAGYRPHIVFTEGEEYGGIGANQLVEDFPKCPFNKCKALIELDRANSDDMVFYDCDNEKFEEFIGKFGFVADIGSFTDISIIAPEWEIAAVNLSVGYLDEHTVSERLHTTWCDATIDKVKNILIEINKKSVKPYKYIKLDYNSYYKC